MDIKSRTLVAVLLMVLAAIPGRAERIKDITDIQGIRSNPLRGIGLVVGLTGTGDTTLPSRQMLTNIYRDAGLVFDPDELTGGNIAVVMVTADLGPFDRQGSRIDVNVSSIGDATSLQGGVLLTTPLKGLDEQVYAVVQAGVSIGGWSVAGEKSSISKNHQTVGRIPGGAVVEKAEIATFVELRGQSRCITLNLRNSDFTTAQRIAEAVNKLYAESTCVVDAGTIEVVIPDGVTNKEIAAFIDRITSPQVSVDLPAVVVINERTGTIVVGENVGISSVAISQGSLVVKVKETAKVSQPIAPFSDAGSTEVVPETIVAVEEKGGHLIPIPQVVTVQELARNLNAIGASPSDLIAIFNALKASGALQARLEIM